MKGFPVLAQTQQLFRDQQMGGGGNRQKFGDALDNAENDGKQDVVHVVPRWQRCVASRRLAHLIKIVMLVPMARGNQALAGRGWLWRGLLTVFILLVPAPILLLLIFRFLPVPGTPEMLVSLAMGKGAHYQWSDDISPRLGGR